MTGQMMATMHSNGQQRTEDGHTEKRYQKPALQQKTTDDDDDDDGTPSMTGSNQFPNLPINPLVKQRKL